MKYIFNFLKILKSWIFSSDKSFIVTGPVYIYSTSCPPEDILKIYIDKKTNKEVFYFDGPISRSILIDKIIEDLQEKEKLIITNFLDEKNFEEIVYVLDRILKENTLLEKKKLKPKDFETWLLEKIDIVAKRLAIQKRILYPS